MEAGQKPARLAFNRFVFDPADARLSGPDGPIRIGNKALDVLAALIAAQGRLLTKDELFDTVWDGTAVSESALTSVIKELRRALGDDRHDARFIESVYGRGYRFLPEVHAVADGAVPAPRAIQPLLAAPPATTAPRRRWLWPAVAALLLLAGIGTWRFWPAGTGGAEQASSSIAVLPFANISGNKDEDYFAAGVTEELRTRLSRLASLQVAARASSVSVKTSGADAQTIGKRLAVGYVIDGSVRREGDIVRVSATLVDTRTGFQRWSQSYDRKLDDVFAIQGDIAQSVASEVQGKLGKTQSAVLDASQTNVPAAFDAYAKGRALFDLSGDEATYRAALASFDRAIVLDPHYAEAMAARARTLAVIANRFAAANALRALYADGLRSARQAVALDPQLDSGQSALGYLLVAGNLDFKGALGPYRRSIALGPNNADVLIPYGTFASRIGRHDDAVAAFRKAALVDPLNARVFKGLGQALIAAGKYNDAIIALRQALVLSPKLTSGHSSIGDALLLLGRPEAARSEYVREPLEFARLTGLAIVEAKLGNRSRAQQAFDRLKATSGDSGAYQAAQILAQWGDRDGAFAAIDTSLRVGDAGITQARSDPLLEPLRTDPRFIRLLARLGLPRY